MSAKKKSAKEAKEPKINKLKKEVGLKEIDEAKLLEDEGVKPKEEGTEEAHGFKDNSIGQQVSSQQPSEKFDLLKWFFIGMVLVFVLGGAWFGVSKYILNSDRPIDLPPKTTGLAVLQPAGELTEDWLISYQHTNLAEIDPANRAEFLSENVLDAANWEFKKGEETLLVWVRVYENAEELDTHNFPFTNDLAWHSTTRLAFGDNGRIGGYRAEGANPPLMLYAEKENKMLYVVYFNKGDSYTSDNMVQDQVFMIDFGRILYGKLDSYEQSLNSSESQ